METQITELHGISKYRWEVQTKQCIVGVGALGVLQRTANYWNPIVNKPNEDPTERAHSLMEPLSFFGQMM